MTSHSDKPKLTRAEIEKLISDSERVAARLTHPGNSLPSRGERMHVSDLITSLTTVAKSALTGQLLPLKD